MVCYQSQVAAGTSESWKCRNGAVKRMQRNTLRNTWNVDVGTVEMGNVGSLYRSPRYNQYFFPNPYDK